MLAFSKHNSLHDINTTFVVDNYEVKATRFFNSKLYTITGEARTIGALAKRVNSVCYLTNEDFDLMSDCDMSIDYD